jgi:hypothetical protein
MQEKQGAIQIALSTTVKGGHRRLPNKAKDSFLPLWSVQHPLLAPLKKNNEKQAIRAGGEQTDDRT